MFSPFGALGFLFGALLFFLLLVRNFFVQRSWYWSIQRGFGMGSRKALTTLFVGRFNCFTRHGESFFFSNSDKKDILGHWNLNLEGSDIRLLRLKRSSVVLTSNRPRLWLRLMGQSIMRSIMDRPILCLVFVNQDHNHQSHDSIQNPRSRKCKKRIFWRKISFLTYLSCLREKWSEYFPPFGPYFRATPTGLIGQSTMDGRSDWSTATS